MALAPNDMFTLKSVTDPSVAACLAITEMQKIYPNLLRDAALVYSPKIIEKCPFESDRYGAGAGQERPLRPTRPLLALRLTFRAVLRSQ